MPVRIGRGVAQAALLQRGGDDPVVVGGADVEVQRPVLVERSARPRRRAARPRPAARPRRSVPTSATSYGAVPLIRSTLAVSRSVTIASPSGRKASPHGASSPVAIVSTTCGSRGGLGRRRVGRRRTVGRLRRSTGDSDGDEVEGVSSTYDGARCRPASSRPARAPGRATAAAAVRRAPSRQPTRSRNSSSSWCTCSGCSIWMKCEPRSST